jgi:hypothetical protein
MSLMGMGFGLGKDGGLSPGAVVRYLSWGLSPGAVTRYLSGGFSPESGNE